MKYLEYFEQHPEENLSWCKCYANKDEDHFLVMYDGEPIRIETPVTCKDIRMNRIECEDLKDFALSVNNGYHCYHGWTDEDIALDVMHEIGCGSCPFRHECEAMHEEMEDNNEPDD